MRRNPFHETKVLQQGTQEFRNSKRILRLKACIDRFLRSWSACPGLQNYNRQVAGLSEDFCTEGWWQNWRGACLDSSFSVHCTPTLEAICVLCSVFALSLPCLCPVFFFWETLRFKHNFHSLLCAKTRTAARFVLTDLTVNGELLLVRTHVWNCRQPQTVVSGFVIVHIVPIANIIWRWCVLSAQLPNNASGYSLTLIFRTPTLRIR